MTESPRFATTYGLAIPHSICGFNRQGDPTRPESVERWLEVLEAPGVSTLWALDQLAGRIATPEPLALLSYMAAITSRPRLGIAVLIGAARGPVAAAKAIATIDWLSEGRVDVGLGLGSTNSYAAYGIDRRGSGGAGAVLDEFIDLVELLWRPEPIEFSGRTWTVKGHPPSPQPLQSPGPPLWVGGASAASMRRAIRAGGGWIGAGRHTLEEFAGHVKELRQLETEEESDSQLTAAKRVYLVVEDDVSVAKRQVREWFDGFYGRPEWGPSVSLFGSAERVRTGLQQLVDAGANHLLLHPLVDSLEQYRRVVEELVQPLVTTS